MGEKARTGGGSDGELKGKKDKGLGKEEADGKQKQRGCMKEPKCTEKGGEKTVETGGEAESVKGRSPQSAPVGA